MQGLADATAMGLLPNAIQQADVATTLICVVLFGMLAGVPSGLYGGVDDPLENAALCSVDPPIAIVCDNEGRDACTSCPC